MQAKKTLFFIFFSVHPLFTFCSAFTVCSRFVPRSRFVHGLFRVHGLFTVCSRFVRGPRTNAEQNVNEILLRKYYKQRNKKIAIRACNMCRQRLYLRHGKARTPSPPPRRSRWTRSPPPPPPAKSSRRALAARWVRSRTCRKIFAAPCRGWQRR